MAKSRDFDQESVLSMVDDWGDQLGFGVASEPQIIYNPQMSGGMIQCRAQASVCVDPVARLEIEYDRVVVESRRKP